MKDGCPADLCQHNMTLDHERLRTQCCPNHGAGVRIADGSAANPTDSQHHFCVEMVFRVIHGGDDFGPHDAES